MFFKQNKVIFNKNKQWFEVATVLDYVDIINILIALNNILSYYLEYKFFFIRRRVDKMNGFRSHHAMHSLIYKNIFSSLILFFILLDEECEEMNKMKDNGAGGVLCFNESLPIMQFIVSKIDETQK